MCSCELRAYVYVCVSENVWKTIDSKWLDGLSVGAFCHIRYEHSLLGAITSNFSPDFFLRCRSSAQQLIWYIVHIICPSIHHKIAVANYCN